MRELPHCACIGPRAPRENAYKTAAGLRKGSIQIHAAFFSRITCVGSSQFSSRTHLGVYWP